MSLRAVGVVIDKLLTDEGLRVRFALDRLETLAELRVRGLDMTADEIELFVRTDLRLWFSGRTAVGDRMH